MTTYLARWLVRSSSRRGNEKENSNVERKIGNGKGMRSLNRAHSKGDHEASLY